MSHTFSGIFEYLRSYSALIDGHCIDLEPFINFDIKYFKQNKNLNHVIGT